LIAALNAVEPYDWAGFFQTRLRSTDPHAPLGGITGGGWKLVYIGTRSDLWKAFEQWRKEIDLSFSIGLRVKEDGTIEDVAMDELAMGKGSARRRCLILLLLSRDTPTIMNSKGSLPVFSKECTSFSWIGIASPARIGATSEPLPSAATVTAPWPLMT
jgi:hypothetical protein